MRDKQHPGRVEDFTDAFLGVCALILFMGFWVIAAVYGFVWVVMTAALVDLVIRRVPPRR